MIIIIAIILTIKKSERENGKKKEEEMIKKTRAIMHSQLVKTGDPCFLTRLISGTDILCTFSPTLL